MIEFRFLVILTVLLSGSINLQAANTYQILAELSNGKPIYGFGFIVYESDDHFFLATARHNVESQIQNVDVMKIYILHKGDRKEAQIYAKHESIDLALIKVSRIDTGLSKFRNSITSARTGDEVYIIGRYGQFYRSETGRINSVNSNEIQADLKGVAKGSSGGPLMHNAFLPPDDKIVGMVYSDDGSIVKAIPIELIMQFVVESLDLTTNQVSDLPIIKLGAQFQGRSTFLRSNEFYPIKDYYDINPMLAVGFFLDLSFSKHFSLLAEINSFSLKANTSDKYLVPTEYKNSIGSYSLSIKYYPSAKLHLHDIDAYFGLGYSSGQMKPSVNIDNTQWVELTELGHQYSRNLKSVKTGFGLEGTVYSYFLIGYSIEYEHFFNKYVYIDVVDPFKVNQKNDWLITMRINVGLKLRRPDSYTKILR